MHMTEARGHIAARAIVDAAHDDNPYSAKTIPKAELFGRAKSDSMRAWLAGLARQEEPPTAEQHAFLASVVQRIELEAHAEQHAAQHTLGTEPLFDMIHGVPGAGKSKLIKWLRSLFEDELGWMHGVQFVCLAFQNAMAALINGFTVHHWTGIPVGEADGAATSRDNHIFASKCQCLLSSSSTKSA